jgi:hypothetical protein
MLEKKITLLFYWILLDQSYSYYYMHSTDRHRHISQLDLLGWYAPIDVIDQYQPFLDKNTTTNDFRQEN